MSHHDKKKQQAPAADPFATIDADTLDKVGGGFGDMGSMMPMMMMMMMRGRGGSAAPPPPPAPVRPKILLNGVEQQYSGSNVSFNSGGGSDGSGY